MVENRKQVDDATGWLFFQPIRVESPPRFSVAPSLLWSMMHSRIWCFL